MKTKPVNAPAQNTSRLSYSYTHRDKMPGKSPSMYSVRPNVGMSFQRNRDPMIAAQIDAGKRTEAQRRHSYMISRQKPAPVLKPSPQFARGPDRTAFNAAMSLERLQASKINKKAAREQSRNSARAQFIQERQQAANKSPKRQFQQARSH